MLTQRTYAVMAVTYIIVFTMCYSTAHAGVVCDKFKIRGKILEDNALELSLDTDLPDDTVLMVSVRRSYFQKGSSTEYSHSYFSEKSTVGEWQDKHKIFIDPKKWRSSLREKQKKLSRIGMGFEIASISENITISMVVPINQRNPSFGKRNSELRGKAVSKEGLRVVRKEGEIRYSLDWEKGDKDRLPSLDPNALEVGATYTVSRSTPVMPSHNLVGASLSRKKIKRIAPGAKFKVLAVVTKKQGPWYKVRIEGENSNASHVGWINSDALIGQELEGRRSSKRWFEGGNLHGGTVGQWKGAKYQNKLATAGEWLAATKWKGHLKSPEDFKRLKVKASMLVKGIDTVVKGRKVRSWQVNEVAAALIAASNDLGP